VTTTLFLYVVTAAGKEGTGRGRMDAIPFTYDACPPVRGFLHRPTGATTPSGDAMVLTHGAGSNCRAPLLMPLAEALAGFGVTVLRCDLPYRQKRPHGPPFAAEAAENREGLRNAVEALRAWHLANAGAASGGSLQTENQSHRGPFERVFLGGHSYGGRQATMLAAESPGLASGLVLLSYPLHPPRQPARLRSDHFPSLRTDALFVQGTRDPFGSIEEMEGALKLIPARILLVPVDGAGHDLGSGRGVRRAAGTSGTARLPQTIAEAFLGFFARRQAAPVSGP
jgi:uncharacterized protein